MADASTHQQPTHHDTDPTPRERPFEPRPTTERDPLDEAARAVLRDALEAPAEHNHAWRIPGGGE
ncbi:MAG: hypothetical protein ACQEXJ_23280 [Myxococcota bacterium]